MIKINRNGGFRHNLAVHQKRLTDRIQRIRELSMGLGERAGWLGLGRVEIFRRLVSYVASWVSVGMLQK